MANKHLGKDFNNKRGPTRFEKAVDRMNRRLDGKDMPAGKNRKWLKLAAAFALAAGAGYGGASAISQEAPPPAVTQTTQTTTTATNPPPVVTPDYSYYYSQHDFNNIPGFYGYNPGYGYNYGPYGPYYHIPR